MMSLRQLRASASAALAVIVVACGLSVAPEPTATPPVSAPPVVAEEMIVGLHVPPDQMQRDGFGLTAIDLPLHSLYPNDSVWDEVVRQFVYSGVYRLDERQSPVPDLAEAPCAVSEDLLVITCELREATFHDATPLTAHDVAFTYQLLNSDKCPVLGCRDQDDWLGLAAATALDERTVEFRLTGPNPAFITATLPVFLVEPKARVEQAYTEFVEASAGADPASLGEVASRLRRALPSGCEAPDEALLREAESAIAEIGRELRSRDAYAIGGEEAFDACAYGDYLVRVLTDAADALSLTGIDAIAAAYRILEPPSPPVGSGPWRIVSIDPGVSMQLEAFNAFYRGIPATARLEVRLIRSTAEAIEGARGGTIHWLHQPFLRGENLIAEGIGDAPGVSWVEYHDDSFQGLHYNLREGRLFADPNLREAIERCMDKDETVAAATAGEGVSIYSPIIPSMWAYEPDLPRPSRDTAVGRELIEASGWTLDEDGIYRKGDQRLAATVPVVAHRPDRIRFVELLSIQLRDCGIEIVTQPLEVAEMVSAMEWPLLLPGTDQPWDAAWNGWISTGPDPDFSFLFHSRHITTEDNPRGYNFMGYASQESDTLLDQARRTYDPRERARLYREHQRILAEDRPILFAWSPRLRIPRSERLESTQGPLATDTSTWWWQLETLFVRPPAE